MFIDERGNNIELTDNTDNYQEVITPPNSPYSYYRTYPKKSLILKNEGTLFYGNAIGIDKTYDRHGRIIKKINTDSGYYFSINSLISLLRITYKIDLLKLDSRHSVSREDDDSGRLFYNVVLHTGGNTYRRLGIDGKTGSIITDETGIYVE